MRKGAKKPKPAVPVRDEPEFQNPAGPPYVGQRRWEIVSNGGAAGDQTVPKLGTVILVTEKGLYHMEFEYRGLGKVRKLRETYAYISPERFCSVADDPRYRSNTGYKKYKRGAQI